MQTKTASNSIVTNGVRDSAPAIRFFKLTLWRYHP